MESPATIGDKSGTIQYIRQAYDTLHRSIEANKEFDADRVAAFHAILDHATHHRGQGVTYLRCVGITPPEYPF